MLSLSRRRVVPVSIRCYATKTSVTPKKKSKKPALSLLKPSSSRLAPPAPDADLKTRLILAAHKNWQKTQTRDNPPIDETGMTEEEVQVAHVERILRERKLLKEQGRAVPDITLPLLDHMLPYAVNFKTYSEYPTWRDMYDQFMLNRLNDGKNAFSQVCMRHIGLADSFPGVSIDPHMSWYKSWFTFVKHSLRARSVKSNAWVAPMRQEFLDCYIKLNKALMHKSSRLEELAMESYLDEALSLTQQRDPQHLYIWRFHREVSPTRILSLRASDGHFGKEAPKTGTRVGVQALVRFDTEQSVEIYDRKGTPLHEPAVGAEPMAPEPGRSLTIVPAIPKRVTEYLVLDNPMYLEGSRWRFRARLEPLPGRTVAA
ncbi:unnamed protein product [Mycena citricolor]|uniref:Uncharacterized protein n=1 Tax=Mycena citricolor TaxID=2018698 RepID=A0AAD2GQR2_9AGAR|nr:unnamed protein product [Mycena citricolor]CAK5261972.1 unnamed protein product [Mycena citricolor]CAK5274539.1 unnamed protein product [Mycena citricolor]